MHQVPDPTVIGTGSTWDACVGRPGGYPHQKRSHYHTYASVQQNRASKVENAGEQAREGASE